MAKRHSTAAFIVRNSWALLSLSSSLFFCGDNSIKPGLPRTMVDCGAPVISHSGEATYYDFADGSGNCCFPATPNDLMVGAMNHADYDGSYACGSCVEITGPDGIIDIRIVDQCPECKPGDIDLSPLAFSKIAAIERGRVPITWRLIACPVTGPIIYHFKDGSNQWWTAVQIRNHRYPVLGLEYRTSGATFTDVPRTDYNYFVKADGMGPGPYIFQVSDLHGHVLIDTIAAPQDSGDVLGSGQFPPCQ